MRSAESPAGIRREARTGHRILVAAGNPTTPRPGDPAADLPRGTVKPALAPAQQAGAASAEASSGTAGSGGGEKKPTGRAGCRLASLTTMKLPAQKTMTDEDAELGEATVGPRQRRTDARRVPRRRRVTPTTGAVAAAWRSREEPGQFDARRSGGRLVRVDRWIRGAIRGAVPDASFVGAPRHPPRVHLEPDEQSGPSTASGEDDQRGERDAQGRRRTVLMSLHYLDSSV
jgi:hypothetical protein